jgi:hypothetical protein
MNNNKKQDRFYKNPGMLQEINPATTFVRLDNISFKRPVSISLEKMGQILTLKIEDDLFSEKNVSSLTFGGQDLDPALPPTACKVAQETQIAVDDNYLYIWVEKLSRWKRILLSDWSSHSAPGALAP